MGFIDGDYGIRGMGPDIGQKIRDGATERDTHLKIQFAALGDHVRFLSATDHARIVGESRENIADTADMEFLFQYAGRLFKDVFHHGIYREFPVVEGLHVLKEGHRFHNGTYTDYRVERSMGRGALKYEADPAEPFLTYTGMTGRGRLSNQAVARGNFAVSEKVADPVLPPGLLITDKCKTGGYLCSGIREVTACSKDRCAAAFHIRRTPAPDKRVVNETGERRMCPAIRKRRHHIYMTAEKKPCTFPG